MDPDKICTMHIQDMNIYTSIIKQIDNNQFPLYDLHYIVSKAELLYRTKIQNAVLLQYCDEKGLVGIEREQIIKTNTTSEFARYANPVYNYMSLK